MRMISYKWTGLEHFQDLEDNIYCADIGMFLHNPHMEEGYTYLYFIICKVSESYDEFDTIKIGLAKDIPKRLRGLQTGCPYNLSEFYRIKVPVKIDRTLERLLHHKFKKDHIRGEWFKFSNEIRNWIGFHKSQSDKKYKKPDSKFKLIKSEDRIKNKDTHSVGYLTKLKRRQKELNPNSYEYAEIYHEIKRLSMITR